MGHGTCILGDGPTRCCRDSNRRCYRAGCKQNIASSLILHDYPHLHDRCIADCYAALQLKRPLNRADIITRSMAPSTNKITMWKGRGTAFDGGADIPGRTADGCTAEF
jgi:hypothetical protein